jgi:hypothetical protein
MGGRSYCGILGQDRRGVKVIAQACCDRCAAGMRSLGGGRGWGRFLGCGGESAVSHGIV